MGLATAGLSKQNGDDAGQDAVAGIARQPSSSGDRVFDRFFKKNGVVKSIEGEIVVLDIEGKTVRSPVSQLQAGFDSERPRSRLLDVTRNVREETNPGQPGFLILLRSEATESGVDARRATKAPAVVLVQYVEEVKERQRSRRVVFRRRSRSSMRNPG